MRTLCMYIVHTDSTYMHIWNLVASHSFEFRSLYRAQILNINTFACNNRRLIKTLQTRLIDFALNIDKMIKFFVDGMYEVSIENLCTNKRHCAMKRQRLVCMRVCIAKCVLIAQDRMTISPTDFPFFFALPCRTCILDRCGLTAENEFDIENTHREREGVKAVVHSMMSVQKMAAAEQYTEPKRIVC